MWKYESGSFFRSKRSFAWLPVKTIDAGWIWFKGYHLYQMPSGEYWFNDFPRLNKPETGHVP